MLLFRGVGLVFYAWCFGIRESLRQGHDWLLLIISGLFASDARLSTLVNLVTPAVDWFRVSGRERGWRVILLVFGLRARPQPHAGVR
jgi:hypothetical protein